MSDRVGFDDQLIETGRQQIDQIDVLDKLRDYLQGDLAGYENAEMADMVIQGVDDGLFAGADVVHALVQIQKSEPSACWGGVMLSPNEANTRIGERMLRKSTRCPSLVTIWLVDSLLPTNSSSVMVWISSPFNRKNPLHHFSNSR